MEFCNKLLFIHVSFGLWSANTVYVFLKLIKKIFKQGKSM